MNSHTLLAKTIHWTFSILYAYGIFKQVEDLDELEDAALLNFEIFFAVVFLVIVMLRFFYMKDAKTLLGAHEEMHKGHLFIAKATHRLVYFSLVMLPATGLLIAGIFNADIPGMGIAIALHEFSAFLSYITGRMFHADGRHHGEVCPGGSRGVETAAEPRLLHHHVSLHHLR